VRSGPGEKQPQSKSKRKKKEVSTVVSSKKKKKRTMMNPIWGRMKKRSPSSGQNGQLVHWWLLVHSGQEKQAPDRASEATSLLSI
jgi:hypothetical protein